jgi:hypothetical protein
MSLRKIGVNQGNIQWGEPFRVFDEKEVLAYLVKSGKLPANWKTHFQAEMRVSTPPSVDLPVERFDPVEALKAALPPEVFELISDDELEDIHYYAGVVKHKSSNVLFNGLVWENNPMGYDFWESVHAELLFLESPK